MIFFGADNPWVWPAQSSAGHITEPKLAPLDEKKMGMTFIMHALRHTFATCANAAGIGIYDLKLLMNHALSGDVTTVYVGSGEHLRRAQQKVTDYINGWMLPEGGRGVSITVCCDGAIWSPTDISAQAGQ